MASKKIEVTEQSILSSDWQKLRPTGIIEVRTTDGKILFDGTLTADEVSKLVHDFLNGITTKLTLTIEGERDE